MKTLTFVIFILLQLFISPSFASKQVHIVYLGEHGGGKTFGEIEDSHHSYLQNVKGSKQEAKASLIYSYKNIINGFAALLTPDEANKLSEMEDVVSVFESRPRMNGIQTTRSWDFVSMLEGGVSGWSNAGQSQQLINNTKYGEDVIVGVFDTGVWPESESFNPIGMGPIPNSWNGSCQQGVAFNSSHCNRKLIGARYYLKGYEAYYGPLNETLEYRSPRDRNGHGTHTSSTLAGRKVPNTSLPGGFGAGTVTGGAPMVRLAMYKVSWQFQSDEGVYGNTYVDVDVLAAFDDAIADGVHVISLSLVPDNLNDYNKDGIAIGALHAVKRDIVVACSAGNYGTNTVRNVAPWIITVAASSTDRVFSSPVVLGNGMTIQGQTVTPYKLDKMYPLVFAGDVELPNTTTTSGECLPGTLSPELVNGTIVLCLGNYGHNVVKGEEVKRAGGVAFILQNPQNGTGIAVDSFFLPGTAVFYNDTSNILNYIKTQSNPNATIVPVDTVLGTAPSPFMAAFSSTGPNGLDPNIIKPDITAPGLNILAAWSEASSPTNSPGDNRVVKYNVLSGTSMSCPHVAAAAALLKAVHPFWSSAAIRSALMTTAQQNNNIGSPITNATGQIATPFDYGSGHFRPAHAADPGLVYDANYTDYLLYLCNYGQNNLDPSFTCPNNYPSPSNLNYPSLAINNISGIVVINRTVTNVGAPTSSYNVTFQSPAGYAMQISPATLNFSKLGERKSFSITINKEGGSIEDGYAFGWYAWSDGIHIVRSPIAISSAT